MFKLLSNVCKGCPDAYKEMVKESEGRMLLALMGGDTYTLKWLARLKAGITQDTINKNVEAYLVKYDEVSFFCKSFLEE